VCEAALGDSESINDPVLILGYFSSITYSIYILFPLTLLFAFLWVLAFLLFSSRFIFINLCRQISLALGVLAAR
jgi:hypothetical protein